MKCKNCNNEVDKEKLSKYASGDFCSKKCAMIWVAKSDDKTETKQGNCSACGKEMIINKRASSKLVKCDKCRKIKKYNLLQKLEYCKKCGKKITGYGRQYCSTSCSSKSMNKFSLEDILNGKHPQYGTSKLKKRLFTKGYFEKKCSICNRTEWNGKPIPTILDHINGESWNHKLENLRIVCPNCDAQLPTFKSKNMGNGRIARREQYKNRVKVLV